MQRAKALKKAQVWALTGHHNPRHLSELWLAKDSGMSQNIDLSTVVNL